MSLNYFDVLALVIFAVIGTSLGLRLRAWWAKVGPTVFPPRSKPFVATEPVTVSPVLPVAPVSVAAEVVPAEAQVVEFQAEVQDGGCPVSVPEAGETSAEQAGGVVSAAEEAAAPPVAQESDNATGMVAEDSPAQPECRNFASSASFFEDGFAPQADDRPAKRRRKKNRNRRGPKQGCERSGRGRYDGEAEDGYAGAVMN